MALNRLKYDTARLLAAAAVIVSGVALTGCHPDMWNQPRYTAFQKSETSPNGMATRIPVAGTYAYQGTLREWIHPVYDNIAKQANVPAIQDDAFYTGKRNGEELLTNYFENVSLELLERGRERYNINCSACHGYAGAGGGMIVRRGFPEAASFHIDRLREVNDGYLFDVITNGFGRMYSYAARVAPEDRWAIIAYIRALQHSQNVDISDPNSEVRRLALAADAEKAHAAEAHGAADAHGDTHHGEADHSADTEAATEPSESDAEQDANAH